MTKSETITRDDEIEIMKAFGSYSASANEKFSDSLLAQWLLEFKKLGLDKETIINCINQTKYIKKYGNTKFSDFCEVLQVENHLFSYSDLQSNVSKRLANIDIAARKDAIRDLEYRQREQQYAYDFEQLTNNKKKLEICELLAKAEYCKFTIKQFENDVFLKKAVSVLLADMQRFCRIAEQLKSQLPDNQKNFPDETV